MGHAEVAAGPPPRRVGGPALGSPRTVAGAGRSGDESRARAIHGSLSRESRPKPIHCNLQPARPLCASAQPFYPVDIGAVAPNHGMFARDEKVCPYSPGFWCQVVMNWGPLAVAARDSQMEPRSRTGAPFRPATTPGDVIGGQSKPLSTLTHLSAHCFQSASLAKGAISALAVGHLSIRDGLTLQQSSSQYSQMLPLAPGKSWHRHGHPRPLRLAVRCASAWRCGPCGTLDEPPEASWRWTECSVHGRSRPACHNGRPLPRTVDKLTSQRLKTAAPQLEPFAAS